MSSEEYDLSKDDDLVKYANDQIKQWRGHVSEWRKRAKESYDFVASEQWTEEEKSQLEEKGRIPVVFNRIARTINAVAGLEVQNRQEVRFIPREQGDAGVNEVLTSAAKWVRDNCDAEDEESEAFQDTLICGMGWTETWLDYETDPEGQIRIDRIDPLDMGWDTTARKRNLDDKRCVFRIKRVPKSEFSEKWSGKTPMGQEGLEDQAQPHDADDAKFYRDNNPLYHGTDEVIVVHFQWWQRKPVYVVGQGTKLIEFEPKRFEKLKDQIEHIGLKYVKRSKRVYYQAFINGNQVLEKGDGPCKDNFSFRCITGLRDRNKNTWFGIVELMKDPQRWANKWLSQIMFIISVNAKGGLMAEEGAFSNQRKAEETWAAPDSITWLKSGGLEKVKEKGQADYPEGLDRLLQYALQSVNDVPGVNLELLGLADREQAGYLEAQRKQAGLTILAIFFDSLRRYRKEQGRVLAYFIKEYISDGRLVRVLGNNGQEQYLPLLRDDETCKYDVVVDDAPTSPNMKEKVFGILSQLVPQLLKAGVPIPPDLLDYMPLPESMVKKWKEHIQQQSQKPDPQAQAEQQKLQFEQQRAQVELQIQQQKFSQEAQLEAQRLELEKQKLALEMQLEIEKANLKAELEKTKLDADLRLKRHQAMADHELQREKASNDAKLKTEVARIESGGLPESQTTKVQEFLSGLVDELKSTNKSNREATEKMLERMSKFMTAEREIVKDKNGNKRSRVVLN